jgi:hypothetical protein
MWGRARSSASESFFRIEHGAVAHDDWPTITTRAQAVAAAVASARQP